MALDIVLAIDIGNSSTTAALWAPNAWQHMYKFPTRQITEQSPIAHTDSHSPHTMTITQFLNTIPLPSPNHQHGSTLRCIVASVVPAATPKVVEAVQTIHNINPTLVDLQMPSPLSYSSMNTMNMKGMGQDLFANAVASYTKSNSDALFHNANRSLEAHKYASITVDMGTALTFTAVRANGDIAGVSITAGIETTYKALLGNTAILLHTDLTLPAQCLGQDTQEALSSGLLLGTTHLINGMVTQMKKELEEPCKVYATGGHSTLLSTLAKPLGNAFDEVNEYHTLDGLIILLAHVP